MLIYSESYPDAISKREVEMDSLETDLIIGREQIDEMLATLIGDCLLEHGVCEADQCDEDDELVCALRDITLAFVRDGLSSYIALIESSAPCYFTEGVKCAYMALLQEWYDDKKVDKTRYCTVKRGEACKK